MMALIRKYSKDRAFYLPLADYIVVPLPQSPSICADAFYETLLHEKWTFQTGTPSDGTGVLRNPAWIGGIIKVRRNNG